MSKHGESGPSGRLASGHFQLFSVKPGGPVFWRLLSGNNRDVGRGPVGFDAAEDCQLAVKELVARLDEHVVQVRPEEDHRWIWRLRDGDRIVAVSGHRFDRQIRCEQGWHQFRNLAAIASVASSVLISGLRRGEPPRTTRAPEPTHRREIPTIPVNGVELRRFTVTVNEPPQRYRLNAGQPKSSASNVDRG